MEKFTQTQALRLANLRILHARPGGAGGPTSDFVVYFLNEKGVSINKTELSDIYWQKRQITDHLASGIERAFQLPSGWLSEDHEFVFQLNPGEGRAIRSLSTLPSEIKVSILSLIASIAAIP